MPKLDFSSYLSKSVDDIEAPKPLPAGHFLATFKSWKGAERDYDKANGGPKTPVVELTFHQLQEDDEYEWELPSNLANMLVTKDYQLNDELGLFSLKRFASETCDVDTKGLDLNDALDACIGSQVKLYNDPRPGKEEGQYFTNIKRVLKAED